MKRIFTTICLWCCALCASAQVSGVFTWQDAGKRLQASQTISPEGPNFSGDQVSLSNGGLSFSATDVSLPGNNDLEVAFSRSYSVKSRKEYYADEMLADWSVSVPHIQGVFTTDWIAGGTTPGNRCSNTAPPPAPGGGYIYSDYWVGLTIQLPGGGGDLQAARTDISPPKPTTGGPYPWVTENGTVYLACLATIKNGTGQGFIATLPNGTRVWYDWMAQHKEVRMKGNQLAIGSGSTPIYAYQDRRRNYLFATRVEDRFGNSVNYTYTNAWNQAGKLTKILASDGRQITINYTGSYVTSVSDGTRTWTYAYSNTSRGRKSLSFVTLPDASAWTIGLSAFTDAEIKYNEAAFDEPLRSCTNPEIPLNYSEQLVGSITHPAGGIGAFTVNIQKHGRSVVSVACGHVSSPNNNPNDDLNTFAISDNSYTLLQKQVSGPGITSATWSYAYVPNISVYRYPGTTLVYPVCNWALYNCAKPHCDPAPPAPGTPCVGGSSKTTVTGPDGNWTRYSYGNTYRNNEGKLLKVETGPSGSTSATKIVTNTYDLTLGSVPKPYPAYYGGSLQPDYDGFSSEYHRPLETTDTDQDGIRFKYHVNTFDGFARPKNVTKSSGPIP